MKQLVILAIFSIICLSFLTRNEGKIEADEIIYDTVYVMSMYNYYVVDDSTLRKEILTDTIHSVDTMPEAYPIYTVRIIRVDTIRLSK